MPRFLSVNAVGQNKHNMRIEVEDGEMYLKNNLQQVWGKGDDQPPGWHQEEHCQHVERSFSSTQNW